MKTTSLYALLSVVFSCVVPTGCSKTTAKPTGKAKELNLYMQAEITSLDPRIGYDRRAVQINRELFEGLMKIGKDGAIEPAIAKSVTMSGDKTVYTFHLKPAKWSNGLDVTADDFVWTWKSILNHSTSTTGSYALFVIKNAKKALMNECSIDDVGVRAIDPSTLEVTLEHPAPYFPELLVLPIYAPVCRTVVEKNANWAAGVFPEFVSNGPYILKDRKIKSHITLEKSPFYRDIDVVATDKIRFAIVEDPQTAYNMFEEGSLDWYGDTFGSISLEMVYELNRKKQLVKTSSGGIHWLLCQTETPHLASPKIRKAIACAINREEICDTLLQGGETPAYTMVHHSISLLEKPSFEYNPVLARQLFEEGMKDLGYTRQTYPPIIITHFSDPTIKAVAEAEQQQLQKNLGIKIELLAVDWGTWLKRFNARDFELIWHIWYTWYQDPTYNLEMVKYKNKGHNNTRWENPEYIRLLDLADTCIDPIVRNSHLRKAEALLMEEFPAIPVFFPTFKYSKRPGVRGEAISAVGQLELKRVEKTG
jgi:oligopeptide transport system substrate-binding protein